MADAKTDDKKWVAPKQRVRTVDSKDYDLGWTVQAPNRPVEPDEMNPVTFSKGELPDPVIMKEQGVPVESYLAHFGNVEGATVDEGLLVDDDSGKPLSEALEAESDVDRVELENADTNPTRKSRKTS